jgi:hypothetical protein
MSSKPSSPNPQVQQAQQMFNSLSTSRKIILIASVVGFIDSFFHWYSASVDVSAGSYSASYSGSESGWHGWAIIATLLFIAAGAWVILPLVGVQVRGILASLPPAVTEARLVMGMGGVALLATILFMVTTGSGASGPGYSEGPSIGAYIGIIVSLAIAAAGFLMQNEPAA